MILKFVLSAIVFACFVTSACAIGPLGAFGVGVGSSKCDPSITTASGTYAMHKGKTIQTFKCKEKLDFHIVRYLLIASGQYCSGDLIFEDTFEIFDTRKWQHENTLSGGGVSRGFVRVFFA